MYNDDMYNDDMYNTISLNDGMVTVNISNNVTQELRNRDEDTVNNILFLTKGFSDVDNIKHDLEKEIELYEIES